MPMPSMYMRTPGHGPAPAAEGTNSEAGQDPSAVSTVNAVRIKPLCDSRVEPVIGDQLGRSCAMTRSTSRRAIAFVALLAAPACGGGSSALFVGTVSRSQFFEYHDEVDEPLCPTLLSMLDQHVQLIGG